MIKSLSPDFNFICSHLTFQSTSHKHRDSNNSKYVKSVHNFVLNPAILQTDISQLSTQMKLINLLKR